MENLLKMPAEAERWDQNQLRRGASFLQSLGWAKFQASQGLAYHMLETDDWSCLLLKKKTALGAYFIAPYGPTLDTPRALSDAINKLKQYGRQNGADWLRLEPMLSGSASDSLRASLTRLGARPAPHNREPDMTRVIDLTPDTDDILASISQSTRSLIRQNQRQKTLTFKTSSDPAEIGLFTHMLGSVTKRNKVNFFSDDYFKKQAEMLMPSGMMVMELALSAGKPIASAIFIEYGKLSSYVYAASLPEARQTSASALLLWQAIQNAKQRGHQKMDLFGIAPDDAPPSHPWQGFSSFKKKFGGEVLRYAGTWDIPLTKKYNLYRTAQGLRRRFKRR